MFLAGLLELGAHVDELYGGHGALVDAVGHGDALVLAGFTVLPAFEGWRGRAKDHWCSCELGAHNCYIAGVIAWGFFLLVALVVFFVDEDQAEIGDWGEDRGTGADNDGGFSATDAMPL